MDFTSKETGTLEYVRGSHKSETFRPHARSGVLGFSQGITDFGTDNDKFVYIYTV